MGTVPRPDVKDARLADRLRRVPINEHVMVAEQVLRRPATPEKTADESHYLISTVDPVCAGVGGEYLVQRFPLPTIKSRRTADDDGHDGLVLFSGGCGHGSGT